jgi:hypothetical protein
MLLEILLLLLWLVTTIPYCTVQGWCPINIMQASKHKFFASMYYGKIPNILNK